MSKNNPVVEIYNGVIIRECNRYVFKFPAPFFKLLILESERTKLPISKILSISSTPCDACSKIDVIAYNKSDDAVKIKRGILSRHHPAGSGRPITQQAKEKIDKK